jgi:hypothetical protein
VVARLGACSALGPTQASQPWLHIQSAIRVQGCLEFGLFVTECWYVHTEHGHGWVAVCVAVGAVSGSHLQSPAWLVMLLCHVLLLAATVTVLQSAFGAGLLQAAPGVFQQQCRAGAGAGAGQLYP